MVVAIYNVWDGLELLRASVDNILKCGVEKVIIVYSDVSNYGEVSKFPLELFQDCVLVQHEPYQPETFYPGDNETNKRNAGLEKAKELDAEMFIMLDCDEFYFPTEFKKAIEDLRASEFTGMVCKSIVYFGKPTLTIGFDTTYVTHLHKLNPEMQFCFNHSYPFETDAGIMRIDPTRRLNINSGVQFNEAITMHHYSWVRHNYKSKIRNSTTSFLRSIENEILRSIKAAEPGHVCALYNKELKAAPDYFNLARLF